MKVQGYLPALAIFTIISLVVGTASTSFLNIWASIELLLYIWLFSAGLSSSNQQGYDSLAQIFCYKTIGGLLILIGLIGLPCLRLGLIIRLAIFPFHFWYIQAFPSLNLFLILSGGLILKIFPLVLWDRGFSADFIASLTSIVGRLAILSSFRFPSLLVSSRISQAGFLVLSLGVFPVLIYLISYYIAATLSSTKNPYAIWNLASLPPIPLFFLKVWILINLPIVFILILLVRVALSFYPYLKFTLANLMYLVRLIKPLDFHSRNGFATKLLVDFFCPV